MKTLRIKLPGGEILTVAVHPSYIHFHRVSPGHPNFVHDVYVPRSSCIPLIRWLVRALAAVPQAPSSYPPLASRRHYQKIAALEENQRAQKKQIAEQQRIRRAKEQKRKRYLAAKRRAKNRRP
jgi:hypothetical protein